MPTKDNLLLKYVCLEAVFPSYVVDGDFYCYLYVSVKVYFGKRIMLP